MLRPSSVAFLLLSLTALAACSDPPPAQMPPPAQPPPVVWADPAVEVGPYNVFLDDPVLVTVTCAGPDPFFAFDVAKPLASDKPTMKNLVACLSAGPMKGRTIKLIGHTDPRGSASFNEKLGLARAENIKKYLVANGIDPAHIVTATMGAQDAAKAPKEWASDRRVQIQLVP